MLSIQVWRTVAVLAVMTLLVAPSLKALETVNDWLYVLQPDGAADLAALTASDFDLLVIDYSSDGGETGVRRCGSGWR